MHDNDFSLELLADKLLTQTGARYGEYPAYSERELRLRRFAHGETLECELSSPDKVNMQPLVQGEKRRIRHGYRALFRSLVRMAGLTGRQRSVVKMILAGKSLRAVALIVGVSKTSVERLLAEAVAKMREQGAGCRLEVTGCRERVRSRRQLTTA